MKPSPITWPQAQKDVAHVLIQMLNQYGVAVSTSGTGCGKTLIAIYIALQLQRGVFVVATKSSQVQWTRWLEQSGLNYKITTHGKFSRGGKHLQVPEGFLVIYDEYKCSSMGCKAGRHLAALGDNHLILINSATPISSVEHCQPLWHLAGICHYNDFTRRCGEWGLFWQEGPNGTGRWKWNATKANVDMLVRELNRFSYGQSFEQMNPGSTVKNLGKAVVPIKRRGQFQRQLEEITRYHAGAELGAKMEFIEDAKVEGLAQLAMDELAEGRSVLAFFSFKKTQQQFCQLVGADSIHGGQKDAERTKVIDDFQTSTVPRCLAANYQAGGESLNLHDVSGVQRTVLLNPTFRDRDFAQAVGRAHRHGMLSVPKQLLVYAADTNEEHAIAKIHKRLGVLEAVAGSQLLLFDDRLEEAA